MTELTRMFLVVFEAIFVLVHTAALIVGFVEGYYWLGAIGLLLFLFEIYGLVAALLDNALHLMILTVLNALMTILSTVLAFGPIFYHYIEHTREPNFTFRHPQTGEDSKNQLPAREEEQRRNIPEGIIKTLHTPVKVGWSEYLALSGTMWNLIHLIVIYRPVITFFLALIRYNYLITMDNNNYQSIGAQSAAPIGQNQDNSGSNSSASGQQQMVPVRFAAKQQA